jgi:hypothetical protein
MNETLNYINLTFQETPCFHLGKIDLNCVYTDICTQRTASFRTGGLILLGCFIAIDFLMPVILNRLNLNVSEIKAKYPLLCAKLPALDTLEGQNLAVAWCKARLLWAFVVWVLIQLFP